MGSSSVDVEFTGVIIAYLGRKKKGVPEIFAISREL
jgi:hypothetical protein